MTEYTVIRIHLGGTEVPLSSGHYIVGQEFTKGLVLWPREENAREAAIKYARALRENFPGERFAVRRTETGIVWDASEQL